MYRKWFILSLMTIQLLESSNAVVTCIRKMGETYCDLILYCTEINPLNIEDYKEAPIVTLDECEEEKNVTIVFNNWYELKYSYNDISVESIRNVIFKIKNFALVQGMFEYFVSCENLDLSNNNIKQIDNYSFRHLVKLKSLNLSKNNIEEIQEKYFCSDYDSKYDYISYITVLDLSFNTIKLLHDRPFSCTPQLTNINLQNNAICLLSQETFGGLGDLKTLYLNGNKLTNLNNSLTPLHNLIHLDLSHNLLTNITESDFTSLTKLRILNVSYNAIVFFSSCFFVRAIQLEVLDLRYNDELDISGQLFLINKTLVPFDVVYKVVKINTDDEKIKSYSITEISKSSFIELKCTSEVNLSFKNISLINNYTFSEIDEIKIVNISKSGISNIEKAAFAGGDSQISILDLSYNRIPNLFFLKDCLENLDELYVNNNNITSLSPMLFAAQTKLTKLDISMNSITNIEQYSLPLSSLRYLNMYGNNLTGVMKRDIFSPAKYLQYLDLSHMQYAGIMENALIDMPNIIKLDLSYNNLGNLSNMPLNLQELYLSNNHIRSIEILKKNYSSNFLILDISSNPINSDINISNFEGLLVANLSNIGLRNINDHKFPDRLKKLYLEINNVTDLNPGSLENLKELQILNISYNFIHKLRYGSFKGLTSLEILDLSNNIIETFDVHVLHDCNVLKHLYLDYNKILYLDYENLIKFAPTITHLSIGGNAIECKDILTIKHRTDLNINVTSIHKISDDDNIHGIRCGSIVKKNQVIVKIRPEDTQHNNSTDMHKILANIIYCCLLVLSLIIVILAFFILYKYRLNSIMSVNNNLPLVNISYDQDIIE